MPEVVIDPYAEERLAAERALAEAAQAIEATQVVDSEQIADQAATTDVLSAEDVAAKIEQGGGYEAYKNKYGADIKACPFLRTLGTAGVELVEKLAAAKKDTTGGRTLAQMLAEKRAKKQETEEKPVEASPKAATPETHVQKLQPLEMAVRREDIEIVRAPDETPVFIEKQKADSNARHDEARRQEVQRLVVDDQEIPEAPTVEAVKIQVPSTEVTPKKREHTVEKREVAPAEIPSVEAVPLTPEIKAEDEAQAEVLPFVPPAEIVPDSFEYDGIVDAVDDRLLIDPEVLTTESFTAEAEPLNPFLEMILEAEVPPLSEEQLEQVVTFEALLSEWLEAEPSEPEIAEEKVEIIPATSEILTEESVTTSLDEIPVSLSLEVKEKVFASLEKITEAYAEIKMENLSEADTEAAMQKLETVCAEFFESLGFTPSPEVIKAVVIDLVEKLSLEELNSRGTTEHKLSIASTLQAHLLKVFAERHSRFVDMSRYILGRLKVSRTNELQAA